MGNKEAFRSKFYNSEMKGVFKADVKAIHFAVQNGEKLTIDGYGRVYNSEGRWIANAGQMLLQEKFKNSIDFHTLKRYYVKGGTK